MNSLLDGIRELVTPALLSRASAYTGESEATTLKGFGMAIPALLASLAGRSGDASFMSQIASLAAAEKSIEPDPITRANVARATSASHNTTAAEKWLSGANGNSVSTVADGIARRVGMRSSSAASLLSIAAPLVLGYIGRFVRSQKLDGPGLAALLSREREGFTAATQTGLEGFGYGDTKVHERAHRIVDDATSRLDESRTTAHARTTGGWAVPLLCAALALGGLVWWVNRDRPTQLETRARNAETGAVGTTGSAVTMRTRSLPDNIDLRIPLGGMEDRLLNYLSTPSVSAMSFDFDRVNFNMASATLTPQSREQLSNAAAILRAYPNARVIVAGYTDNVGNPATNVELSRSRAIAVRNALQGMGISGTRIRAEGFGSQSPVADNRTEEGRARNRRVTLRVSAN